MTLSNSQILGVLKRLTAEKEALDAVRLTCAAYLEAAEGLATIDNTKAQKMKEIAAIEEQIRKEAVRPCPYCKRFGAFHVIAFEESWNGRIL